MAREEPNGCFGVIVSLVVVIVLITIFGGPERTDSVFERLLGMGFCVWLGMTVYSLFFKKRD